MLQSKKAKTIVTTIVLLMALVQVPLFYYDTFGAYGLIVIIPYSLTGLGLTIALLSSLTKHSTTNSKYHIWGLIITVFIAFPTRYKERMLEYVDWKLQFNKRNRIVEQVKAGFLTPGEDGRCKLNDNSFLPLSTGGNEILITHDRDGVLEIEFYIESGFLDHYSALVYSDRAQMLPYKNNSTVTTLNAHWYALHF